MYAFFVVRALRRKSIGRQAAQQLLRLIPGQWGIAFQDDNQGARPFWELVASKTVGNRRRLDAETAPEGQPVDIWLRFDTRHATDA